CDASRMVLRLDGELAHPSPNGARGIAHVGAENFGQGDEGHWPMSSITCISDPNKDNSLSVDVTARICVEGPPSYEDVKGPGGRAVVRNQVVWDVIDGRVAADADAAGDSPGGCAPHVMDVA